MKKLGLVVAAFLPFVLNSCLNQTPPINTVSPAGVYQDSNVLTVGICGAVNGSSLKLRFVIPEPTATGAINFQVVSDSFTPPGGLSSGNGVVTQTVIGSYANTSSALTGSFKVDSNTTTISGAFNEARTQFSGTLTASCTNSPSSSPVNYTFVAVKQTGSVSPVGLYKDNNVSNTSFCATAAGITTKISLSLPEPSTSGALSIPVTVQNITDTTNSTSSGTLTGSYNAGTGNFTGFGTITLEGGTTSNTATVNGNLNLLANQIFGSLTLTCGSSPTPSGTLKFLAVKQ